MMRQQPRSPLFPYTTLFRSAAQRANQPATVVARYAIESWLRQQRKAALHEAIAAYAAEVADRKSTRLNSSHTVTSYAVFCLKKKTKPACGSPRTTITSRARS